MNKGFDACNWRSERTLVACTDNQNMPELLKCSLGGVSICVSAPGELHEDLSAFQRRMAAFKEDMPIDLSMAILKSRPKEKYRGSEGEKGLTNNFILDIVQNETLIKKRELLLKATQHLKLLLLDPAMHDPLKLLVSHNGKLSFVPLEAGFLFVNLSIGEALLLLDEEWRMNGSCTNDSWGAFANITAINAVMALLAIYLAERGDGLITHGTGVSLQNRGYLFLAPSGGGKTALSMHSPAGSVLADDGIIIRESKNDYRLYPTPLRQRPGGEIKEWAWQQAPVTLQAVFILDKGSQTRIKSIPRPQAIGFLVNALTHFFLWMKPGQATRVFDFWRRLGTIIPIAGLEWRLKSEFWPAIDDFIIKGKKYESSKKIPKLAGRI